MTRLPIVDYKTMDKVLRGLGFERMRQKGVMFFIAIPMEKRPRYRTIQEEISPGH